ncbi:unnamed protein product, partial [Brenthis ino]
MLQRVAILILALAVHQAPARDVIPVGYVENIESNSFDLGSGSRIVSGWDALPGQHPHQAQLRLINANGQVQSCGGSIIHREWVITAAHCSAGQVTIIVRAGGVELARPDVSIEASASFFYPTFDTWRPLQVQHNDVSLLKLQEPLQFTQNIRSIRLQPSSDAYRDYANEIVYASGFGRTWSEGPVPDILQWVYLRGVSNLECARTYGTDAVNDNTICARFFNVTSQSICQGDSGGPLVHVSPEGEPILIGISSFVPRMPHGCHSGFPGAFIRPGPFHFWFKQITGIDFDNLNDGEDINTEEPIIPTTLPPTTWAPPATDPTTESTTVTLPTTTTPTPPTTPDSDEDEEDEDDDDDDDDKELSELLKRLEVKVKVKVKMSKYGQKKYIKKNINKD